MRRFAGNRELKRGVTLLSLLMVLSTISAAVPAPFHGALTRQVNLMDLASQAGTIVHAHVVSARVEPHPDYKNLTTVVVSLRVEESIKGGAPSIMSFRQFIWDPRDRTNGAGYQKGQELLLFLTRPSAIGLSAPVGLDQGRISVSHDPLTHAPTIDPGVAGRLLAGLRPDLARAGLLPAAASTPVALGDFARLARSIEAKLAPSTAP